MDMLRGAQIAQAGLVDWRKLAQGLHARYLVDDFGAAARFVVAVGEVLEGTGHGPRVSVGPGYVDLKLVSDDAVHRDHDGVEHVVEWVTQRDVGLARRISEVAAEHRLRPDPAAVSMLELGLDTSQSEVIAPVWVALLTGAADAQGRGTPGDEIRDRSDRVPHLWFGAPDVSEPQGPRLHLEVYVPPEVVEQRIAAVVAAGGTVVDGTNTPALTVISDQDGNRGVLCADVAANGFGAEQDLK